MSCERCGPDGERGGGQLLLPAFAFALCYVSVCTRIAGRQHSRKEVLANLRRVDELAMLGELSGSSLLGR